MANKKHNTHKDDVITGTVIGSATSLVEVIGSATSLVEEPVSEYASILTAPTPTQITVNIEDVSMLKEIKRTISMIRGVVSVEKSPAMKSYERARADVKAGRVVKFDSLDDLKTYFDKL